MGPFGPPPPPLEDPPEGVPPPPSTWSPPKCAEYLWFVFPFTGGADPAAAAGDPCWTPFWTGAVGWGGRGRSSMDSLRLACLSLELPATMPPLLLGGWAPEDELNPYLESPLRRFLPPLSSWIAKIISVVQLQIFRVVNKISRAKNKLKTTLLWLAGVEKSL